MRQTLSRGSNEHLWCSPLRDSHAETDADHDLMRPGRTGRHRAPTGGVNVPACPGLCRHQGCFPRAGERRKVGRQKPWFLKVNLKKSLASHTEKQISLLSLCKRLETDTGFKILVTKVIEQNNCVPKQSYNNRKKTVSSSFFTIFHRQKSHGFLLYQRHQGNLDSNPKSATMKKKMSGISGEQEDRKRFWGK